MEILSGETLGPLKSFTPSCQRLSETAKEFYKDEPEILADFEKYADENDIVADEGVPSNTGQGRKGVLRGKRWRRIIRWTGQCTPSDVERWTLRSATI
jgi:hypothetical protein